MKEHYVDTLVNTSTLFATSTYYYPPLLLMQISPPTSVSRFRLVPPNRDVSNY